MAQKDVTTINLWGAEQQRRYQIPVLMHLAPLLLSTKPSALINLIQPADVWQALLRLNPVGDLLSPLSSHLFSGRGRRRMLLLYRPDYFKMLADRQDIARFLESYGYQPDFELNPLFEHWQQRLEQGTRTDFPHETGIFLGIPLDDVRGFIRHQGKNYLFNRYWKVYRHPEQAMQTFRTYDGAKERMSQIIAAIGGTESSGAEFH